MNAEMMGRARHVSCACYSVLPTPTPMETLVGNLHTWRQVSFGCFCSAGRSGWLKVFLIKRALCEFALFFIAHSEPKLPHACCAAVIRTTPEWVFLPATFCCSACYSVAIAPTGFATTRNDAVVIISDSYADCLPLCRVVHCLLSCTCQLPWKCMSAPTRTLVRAGPT